MRKLLDVVLGLYMMSAMAMGAYYNWQYARDNGFVKWMMFGEIVPTLKAFVWPYFEFVSDDRQRVAENEALRKVGEGMLACSKASQLLGKWKTTPYGQIPRQVWNDARRFQNEAIAAAEGLDVAAVDRVYPQLGTMYMKEVRALTLIKQAADDGRTDLLPEAQRLEYEFIDWVNPRLPEIKRLLRERVPS